MDLKLGHHAQDGIEVIDVQGEIDIYTAPRLRELLIDLVSKGSYQLVVNLDEVGFLDSTGLGVLVGGLRRVRARDGSLDLVCTQQRILKILKITGLTEVSASTTRWTRPSRPRRAAGKERGSWPSSALRPRAPERRRGGRVGAGRGLQRPATWGVRLPGSRVAGRAGQARSHGLARRVGDLRPAGIRPAWRGAAPPAAPRTFMPVAASPGRGRCRRAARRPHGWARR